MQSAWTSVIGTVAATLTTTSFLPQLVKLRRQGGRDLSYWMLLLYFVGLSLWLAYGLILRAPEIVMANVATLVLVGTAVVMKFRAERQPAATAVGGRRLRIAIDMDEVMADSLSELVRRCNETFGCRFTRDDFERRRVEDLLGPERAATVPALFDESFFERLPVVPGAQEVIRELASRHDVFVVTAAMEVPRSFNAKYRWLRTHFPFIPPSHIVFCGDKGVVDADYLIDDTPRQLAAFRGRPLLFSAPHNRGETRFPRVDSWSDVARFFGVQSPHRAPALLSGQRVPA